MGDGRPLGVVDTPSKKDGLELTHKERILVLPALAIVLILCCKLADKLSSTLSPCQQALHLMVGPCLNNW